MSLEPKALIQEKLFSNEDFFIDNEPYTGPYNIRADGSLYTLSRYIDGKSKELKSKRVSLYQRLLAKNGGIDVSVKNGQVLSQTIVPTQEDYDKGKYTRHFIRTKGTKVIVEVGVEDFDLIGSKIDDNLYIGFTLDWKITGPINDIYVDDIRQEAGIVDTNRRTLQRLEKEQAGILEKLSINLRQFSK